MNKRVILFSVLALCASIGLVRAGEFGRRSVEKGESSRGAKQAMTDEELFEVHKEDAIAARKSHITYVAGVGDLRTVAAWLNGKIPSRLTLAQLLLLKDQHGSTALMWASSNGHSEVVELLLAYADRAGVLTEMLKARALNGNTALTWAASRGRDEIVKMLLKTALEETDILVDLMQVRDNDGKTALSWAAGNGHVQVVRLLLRVAKGEGILADIVQAQNNEGSTALMWAASNGHTEVVKNLLEKVQEFGMSKSELWSIASHATKEGMSTLMSGATAGSREIVQLILNSAYTNRPSDKAFIDFVNAQDALKGRTAIQWAIRFVQGSVEKEKEQHSEDEMLGVIEEIFKYDNFPHLTVNIISQDKNGKTAIFWAAYAECNKILRFFENVARRRNYSKNKFFEEIEAGKEMGRTSTTRSRSPIFQGSSSSASSSK